jgi:hypothetical protein
MKTLTDEEKACRVIEVLVSDDLCQDLEFNILVHNDCRISPEDAKILNNKLITIYELTHVANKPACLASHDDWLKKLNTMYKTMKKRGEVK